MSSYLYWLIGISLGFVVLERLRPARRGQRLLRPQIGNDLVYLAVNGFVFWLLAGALATAAAVRTDALLERAGLAPGRAWLADAPFALQLLIFFVAGDLLQWCVHLALHRVPLLWHFHKVHHSIHEMDWIGNFRFHWMELVVYRSALYVPLFVWLGPEPAAVFVTAVATTAWGFFNHSNLRADLGRLGYVLNGPAMHLWHHDRSSEGGHAKNFAVVLSLWDWIFGTAYWPRGRAPRALGYEGDAEMPRSVLRQLAFPLLRQRPSSRGPRPPKVAGLPR